MYAPDVSGDTTADGYLFVSVTVSNSKRKERVICHFARGLLREVRVKSSWVSA